MNFLDIDSELTPLLTSGRFQEAESLLQSARVQASEESDVYTLELVLAELAFLNCLIQPPDFGKAEAYCLQRERVNPSGQSKLQTALMYYWSMHDPERTAHKAQEAAKTARSDGDTATVYQSLSLLGLALLDLGRTQEATELLPELQRMIAERNRIVVGDETLFLERLASVSEELDTRSAITGIARTLWPVCRDEAFATRLRALAAE